MKNYYNTKLDLENKKDRLKVVEHNLEKANSQLYKITSTLKDNATSGGKRDKDKIANLIADIQEWQNEIIDLKESILYLTPYVEKMEKRVNAMVGIHKEVFEMLYKDNMKVKHIARKLNFSIQRVYQLRDEVNRNLGIK